MEIKINLHKYKVKKGIYAKAGSSHSLILDLKGKVHSFGYNNMGQLGLGDDTVIVIPYHAKILFRNAKNIAVVSCYNLIIDINYDMWSFGFNEDGQLGLGHNINISMSLRKNDIKFISSGADHSLAIEK